MRFEYLVLKLLCFLISISLSGWDDGTKDEADELMAKADEYLDQQIPTKEKA
jgi:hypothetical protein